MFPPDGKIKPAVAGVPNNGRKKWFPLAKKSVSTSRDKDIFQKFDLPVFTSRTEISKLKNIVSTRWKVGFH